MSCSSAVSGVWDIDISFADRKIKRSLAKDRIEHLRQLGSGTFAHVVALSSEIVIKVYDTTSPSFLSTCETDEDEEEADDERPFLSGVVNSYPLLREIASMFILDEGCRAAGRPPVAPVLYRFRSKGDVAHLFMQRACCLDDRDTYRALVRIAKEEGLHVIAKELEATCWATLAFVHSMGIMHRDIKPANMVLAGSEDGDGSLESKSSRYILERPLRLMLIDWNSSRFTDAGFAEERPCSSSGGRRDDHWRPSGALPMTKEVYTAYTRPPELCQNVVRRIDDCTYDDRADVWAMGMAMLNILTKLDDFWNAELEKKIEPSPEGGSEDDDDERAAKKRRRRRKREMRAGEAKMRRVFETFFVDPLSKCASFEEECKFMCSQVSSEFGRFHPSACVATEWFERRVGSIPRAYSAFLESLDEALRIDPAKRCRAIDILKKSRRRKILEASGVALEHIRKRFLKYVEPPTSPSEDKEERPESEPEPESESEPGPEPEPEPDIRPSDVVDADLEKAEIERLGLKVVRLEPALDQSCATTHTILEIMRRRERPHPLSLCDFWGVLLLCATLLTPIVPSRGFVASRFAKLRSINGKFEKFILKTQRALLEMQKTDTFFEIFILTSFFSGKMDL